MQKQTSLDRYAIKKMTANQVKRFVKFLKRHHARTIGLWIADTDGEKLFTAKKLTPKIWECKIHQLMANQIQR